MKQRGLAKQATDATVLFPKVAQSASVNKRGGVDEVTNDLAVGVGTVVVGAIRIGALVGVVLVDGPSQLVERVNDMVCQFVDFACGHCLSFLRGWKPSIYTNEKVKQTPMV